ncbi:MAG: hypothetical protein QM767_16610 [Anaeromyxobacter sp.]
MTPAREGHGGATLRALVELRLLLLWRALRGRAGVPDLVARIFTVVMAIPAGVAFAVMAGWSSFGAVRTGHGLAATWTVTALYFGVWQAWTAMALTMNDREALDLRRYLVYPLRPGRVYAYGLTASVLGDPFAVFWSLILLGAFAGATLARPGPWAVLLALVNLTFAAATAAGTALLQELAARVMRGRRRVREVGIAAIYVGLAFLLAWGSSRGWGAVSQLLGVLKAVRWLALPASLADLAARPLYQGRPLAALPWLGALALSGAAMGWAAFRLALAEARSGSDGVPTRVGGSGAGAGWRLPGRLGPLLEKELKYLLRHPLSGVLALVVPGFAAFVGWRAARFTQAEASEVVTAVPLLGFALYAHLVTQVFWLNALGSDRGGTRLWFLAPVDPGDVLRAKNVGAVVMALVLFGASASALTATQGAPPAWAAVGAAVLFLSLAPWFLSAGNLVSTLNPRAMPRTVQRGGWIPPLSALLGMAILVVGGGIFSVPVLVGLWLDSPWAMVGGWAALGLAGAAVYRAALPRTGRLLARRREAVLDAVAGDDA